MVCSLKIRASYAKPDEIPYSYKTKLNTFKTIDVQFGSHYEMKMLPAFPIHCVKHQTPPHLCRAVNHSKPQSGSFLSFPSSTQKENLPVSVYYNGGDCCPFLPCNWLCLRKRFGEKAERKHPYVRSCRLLWEKKHRCCSPCVACWDWVIVSHSFEYLSRNHVFLMCTGLVTVVIISEQPLMWSLDLFLN